MIVGQDFCPYPLGLSLPRAFLDHLEVTGAICKQDVCKGLRVEESMYRHAIAVVSLLVTFGAAAQTSQTVQPATSSSDATAVLLAQKSIAALTGGTPVTDVTLNGNVISTLSSAYDSGTATLQAKGLAESRVDMNLSSGSRSDVRSAATGVPSGAWQRNGSGPVAYAQHNCWTDAAWFFPPLSALTQTANAGFVFSYIGAEQHNGVNSQHIRVSQTGSQRIQDLSTMDFYLDATSGLPLALVFQARADNDVNTRIATEIRFSQYQSVNGLRVPFHFQQLSDGNLSLDFTLTNVSINTGLPDTLFTLP